MTEEAFSSSTSVSPSVAAVESSSEIFLFDVSSENNLLEIYLEIRVTANDLINGK
jgi:hypothetical protein